MKPRAAFTENAKRDKNTNSGNRLDGGGVNPEHHLFDAGAAKMRQSPPGNPGRAMFSAGRVAKWIDKQRQVCKNGRRKGSRPCIFSK